MSKPGHPHVDVAGYALGSLTPPERARFEEHLESCAACRAELDELRRVAEALPLALPRGEPPLDLEARTLAAVRRARDEAASPARPRSMEPRGWALHGWARRAAVTAAAVIALLGAFVLGGRLAEEQPAGSLELTALLRATDGGAESASVRVTETGVGRVVELSSDDLPILPAGELYEVWFVGPEDRPNSPQRISAGTFHPDADGRSEVRLAAAADPALYPVISVTSEPGDGDPAPGREVLRSGR